MEIPQVSHLEFTVFKMKCIFCKFPYYELHNGLLNCPHCNLETHDVHCSEESFTHQITADPRTGQVILLDSTMASKQDSRNTIPLEGFQFTVRSAGKIVYLQVYDVETLSEAMDDSIDPCVGLE